MKPSTVISWQRKRFRDHWTRLSRPGRPGRPSIAQEIRDLIRKISRVNPSWRSLRTQLIVAARSPWQSPYVERLIGSIRRECLDNVVVLGERHLQRILKDYFSHYHCWRCHQSLEMDFPEPRSVPPPEVGEVVEVPEVGGVYRHFERAAA